MRRTSRDLQPHPLRVFEENYLLIRRLFPSLGADGRYALSVGDGREAVQAVIEECSRYTTTMRLSNVFDGDARLLPPLLLQVRIYHDACLAEVIGYQACRHIPPPYAVTRGGMFQRDERKQVNRLLHEVLRRCLRQGYRAVPISDVA